MQRSLDPSPCPWCSEAVGLTSGHQQGAVTARCLKLELPQNHSVGQGCGDNKFLVQRMLKIDAFRTWNGQNHQMQSTESIWVSRKWSPIGASQIHWSSGDCHPGYKMLLFKTNNQTVINNYWLKKISICPLLGVNTHCLAIAFTCIIYNISHISWFYW
jgi:hypothetical protein